MPKLLLFLVSLGFFSIGVRAQDFWTFRYITPYINPSITVGAGSGHAYQIVPSLDLRFSRFSLSISHFPHKNELAESIQLETDLLFIKSRPKYIHSVSFTFGINDVYPNDWSKGGSYIEYSLFGYNWYKRGGRGRVSVKIGPAWNNWDSRNNGLMPYAGVSYRTYLFKLGYKAVSYDSVAARIRKFAHREPRHQLNIGLSFGIGGAHPATFFPTGVLRLGSFSVESGLAVIPEAICISLQVMGDVWKLREGRKYHNSITVTGGGNLIGASEGDGLIIFYGLAGYRKQRILGRHSLDFKLGPAWGSLESDFRWYPYGQVSYTVYLKKFRY